MNFRFDHCYTNDPKHRFMKKLARAGFLLATHEVEHPGKQFCRFIKFVVGTKTRSQYLEFVNVKDGGEKVRQPGLSYQSEGSLDQVVKRLKTRGLSPAFFHKNYD